MNPEPNATTSREEMAPNPPRRFPEWNIGRQKIVLQEGFELEVRGTEETVTFSPDDLCMLRKVIDDWPKVWMELTRLICAQK